MKTCNTESLSKLPQVTQQEEVSGIELEFCVFVVCNIVIYNKKYELGLCFIYNPELLKHVELPKRRER